MAMVERSPVLTFFTHFSLVIGVLIFIFPIYVVFVASSVSLMEILRVPMAIVPGGQFFGNYYTALTQGIADIGVSSGVMLANSTIMALGVSIGKIVISMFAAFAFVFFRFPGRQLFFWAIFVTLMLPVQVRILPTYEVVANLGMLNSYAGLILPIIPSATATFLFRQYFMSIPREMPDSAKVDGASPMQFFWAILVPVSKTTFAALFVILFIFGWNQYLWPLLVTTQEQYYTLLIGINRMLAVGDQQAQWHIIMASTILAMVPPVFVVMSMRGMFMRGMTEQEK